MSLSSPQSFAVWEDESLLAECRFTALNGVLRIESIDVFAPELEFDPVDALVRAVVSHCLPLTIERVICEASELTEPLLALRFVQKDGYVESTPDEVLRRMCASQ